MVLHDPQATHVRRVRVMVQTSGIILMVLGLAYGLFFAFLREWAVVSGDVLLVLIGFSGIRLMRRGRQREATFLIVGGLYLVLLVIAVVMDLPRGGIPRASHHFLIPLAVASYLFSRHEAAWIRFGIPLACLATLVTLTLPGAAIVTPYAVPDDVRAVGTWVNNLAAMAVLYLLVHIFIGDIGRMETYLQNANHRFVAMVEGMFPASVAERLLTSGESFARRHTDCSILFADIVSFTHIAEKLGPQELVNLLAEVFRRFDLCVEQSGLTKIKTIGDAYMVAAGVPQACPGHAVETVQLARSMMLAVKDIDGIELRIGISSGELVAGVIGQSRQVFDVWGNVVNMAARMESHGLPGKIQLSASSFALARHRFHFEKRSNLAIKGKSGLHDAYLLAEA
jgi:class 3 adenylate cyclase